MTVTLAAEGERTVMTFEQTGFPSVESRDGHGGGWTEAFGKLARHVAQAGRT